MTVGGSIKFSLLQTRHRDFKSLWDAISCVRISAVLVLSLLRQASTVNLIFLASHLAYGCFQITNQAEICQKNIDRLNWIDQKSTIKCTIFLVYRAKNWQYVFKTHSNHRISFAAASHFKHNMCTAIRNLLCIANGSFISFIFTVTKSGKKLQKAALFTSCCWIIHFSPWQACDLGPKISARVPTSENRKGVRVAPRFKLVMFGFMGPAQNEFGFMGPSQQP